ncbi:MAG: shikimate dehydrogenase [Verrucomicrobiae bacterium]|nr:shikimate dehydrogenase [Verrucomicrobiae bacterium]
MSEPLASPINASTRYCAVLGWPVRHSASPAFQNAGLTALGLNWRYLAFAVRPEHLSEVIAGARRMQFIGLNLTVPHKLLACQMVDALDASARHYGAVNTIRFEAQNAAGEWRPLGEFEEEAPGEIRAQGFNTDAEAIVQALREDLDFTPGGASVLLLGAGGAGQVAALKLADAGVATLYLVNRTRQKAEEVAQRLAGTHARLRVHVGYPTEPVDLVLNATSLGLRAADPLPLDTAQFPLARARLVYDMIYRPAETALLQAARAAGCRTANGLSMLLHQGVKALEIWSGRPAPVEVMRRALREHVYGHV